MSQDVEESRLSLSTDKFRHTKTGVVVNGEFTEEEWLTQLRKISYIDGAIQWWIGDLAVAGEVRNGIRSELYDRIEEETGFKRNTLKNCKSVSASVDLSLRRDRLSFGHHKEVWALPPEQQDQWLDRAEQESMSVAQLRRAIKAEKYEDVALPDGKYRIIYADPPWQYGGEQHGSGAAQDTVLETHYGTMTIDQICQMDVSGMAADDSVLFLWATVPLLREGLRVMEAWGFDYKTHFVWDKVLHNVGHYNSVRHELLLVGGRGRSVPDVAELADSVYSEERTEHSRKPEWFRQWIDSHYTGGARIELFRRGVAPAGWTVSGNEVINV